MRTRSLFGGKLNIQVNIDENANRNSPVAIAILLVYDEKLLDQLKTYSAKMYFQKREQIRLDYTGKEGFESWEYEWSPGQFVPLVRLPLEASAKGGILYVDYSNKGEHRILFDPGDSFKVRLMEKRFSVNFSY